MSVLLQVTGGQGTPSELETPISLIYVLGTEHKIAFILCGSENPKRPSNFLKLVQSASPRRKVQTDSICFQTTVLNRDCRGHQRHQKIHLFLFSDIRKTYQGQETLIFLTSKFGK